MNFSAGAGLRRLYSLFGRWTFGTLDRGWCGLTLGIAAVTVIQQTILTFGLSPHLVTGMLLGAVAGLAAVRAQAGGAAYRLASAGYLLAVIALWPTWLAALMDGIGLLPAGLWSQKVLVDGLEVAAGLLGTAVPVAVCVSLIPEQQRRYGRALLLAFTGGLLQLVVLVPLFGLWLPATVAALVLVLVRIAALRQPVESLAGSHHQPVPAAGLVLAGVLGLCAGATSELLSALWAVSPTLWHAPWLAMAGGVGAGLQFGRGNLTRWCTTAGAMALVLLALTPRFSDVSLWLNGWLTTAAGLEAARVSWICVCLMPLGLVLGAIARNASFDWFVRLAACFVCGVLLSELFQQTGVSPAAALTVAGLAAIGSALATGWNGSLWVKLAVMGTLTAALVTVGVWSADAWNPYRPARLLFSTHVLLAARSGWETTLLPQLDDTRPIANAVGRNGWWTLWQARGGEILLRENGIPAGTLTTAPDWSPQFAPEVLPVIWPLVLVDQPARVLMLGARSGAGLQAALVFPIREVVCHEPDAGLVRLIRGPIAAACGHDPFCDERCRHVEQPSGWLAGDAAKGFDVIVSQPATAALQHGSDEFTVEFYRRAARRLTTDGVFCQRFSAIDFGPQPLLSAVAAVQQAFPETACLEIGPGEFLLLAAHRAGSLVRPDLPQRLEAPHVAALLSKCQWDWVVGLNLPAYDRAALAEAIAETRVWPNTSAQGQLPFVAARELMRWGPKLQETAAVLSKPRTTWHVENEEQTPVADAPGSRSRRSRYLEWLGRDGEQPTILRRLSEVIGQQQLVQRFPDTHWYEYRRELREQLQEHPRTPLEQVSYRERWHPEDRQRKSYFEALGEATKQDRPTLAALEALEATLDPCDPLLTLFGHQEVAELYARGDVDPARELRHRLHVIYFAPAQDVSVRNVVAAIDRLVEHPAAIADDAQRFDVLNGLLQTLRARWEGRSQRPQKSTKVTLQEIERSLVSVEKAVQTLQPLAVTVGYTPADWQIRELVLERLLLRPFRSYRDTLRERARESELKTRALLDRATSPDGR